MKILLIFPNYLENFFVMPATFHPPLGLAMVAAILKNAGHDVNVIDATAERLNIHGLEKRIKKIQPEIIGITANVSFTKKAVLTGKWIKRKTNIPVIFGGPGPTVEYERFLKEGAADIVVIGESEQIIGELLDKIKNQEEYVDVKGIAFKHDSKIIVTSKPSHIANLDNLPFPAWEFFPPPSKYFFNARGSIFYPIMTSRGCPSNCIFCTKAVHGHKYRSRSVENIISEIIYLKNKFKADEIIIADDNFNHDIKRAELICDEIIKLDFKINLRFSNGIRADKLTPRLALKLKKAGAYSIALGIETINQSILEGCGKLLSKESIERAINMLKKLGIFTIGFFMVGLPGETIKTMLETKKFLKSTRIDQAVIFKTIPFPGTKMYEFVKNEGKFLGSYDQEMNFTTVKGARYDLPGIPSELMDIAFQDFYKTFFFRFSKILGIIRSMQLKNWFFNLNFALRIINSIFKREERVRLANNKKIVQEKVRAKFS